MKRKFVAIALVAAMSLGLAACGGSGASSTAAPAESKAETTASSEAEAPAESEAAEVSEAASTEAPADVAPLTINVYNPVSGVTTDGIITDFASRVEELSGGAITCNVTPAGTLGAERETTDLLNMGDVDMTLLSIDGVDMATPNVGMSWICLPGLFSSYDEVDSEFINGWMFERQKEVAAEENVDLIAPIEQGLKVIIGTGDPVETMDDFKGMVLRVPDVAFHHAYYAKMGCTTVSGIDQYTGMQQKTMDGIPNNCFALELFNVDEVCDWIMELYDIYGTMYWVANQSWMDGLDQAQQDIINQAATETAEAARDGIRQIGYDWLKMCDENPDITVYKPSDELKSQLNDIGYEIWQEFQGDFDPVAMEKLLADYAPEK